MPFFDTLRVFLNLAGKLLYRHPILFFGLLSLAYIPLALMTEYHLGRLASTSIPVVALSLILFARSASFAETTLTFVLGLFTVFGVDWDRGKALVFITFASVFGIGVFVISAIRLAAREEAILTQAAVFYNLNESRRLYQHFAALSKGTEKLYRLSVVEAAEVIRYFAFRRLPVEDFPLLVLSTEKIMILLDLDWQGATPLAHVLQTNLRLHSAYSSPGVNSALDRLMAIRVSPVEFLTIVSSTRHLLARADVTWQAYIDVIDTCAVGGLSVDQTIAAMNNPKPAG